jgi:hypothetical protein
MMGPDVIEPDERLQKLLREWQAPAPDPRLDARVWKSFRQSAGGQRARHARKWLAIAAGVLLVAAGSAKWWMAVPAAKLEHRSISLKTTADAAGFTPVSNGTITVVKEERNQ